MSYCSATESAVSIVAGAEPPNDSTATLHHRGDFGAFDETPLVDLGGAFTATLPTFTCLQSPEYYISVESTSGVEVVYPSGAPGELLTSVVASDVAIAFDDNGETDPGWTTSGSASDGQWDRGIPANGGRGDPPADADGSGQCWLTDNVAGNSDVDNGNVILTSPILETPGDGWNLSYWRWFSNDFGAAPSEDIFVVEWSAVGSSVWSLLEQVGPLGASGGWVLAEFDLDASGLEGVESFQLRFTAEDAGSGSIVEAAIDGVQILKIDCVDEDPCLGDVNGSGAVDVDDILQVLSAFGTNDPSGDVNGDGVVDVDDILGVVGAFGPC